MDKKSDTNLTMRFFLDCEMNKALNHINEAYKRIGLLKHRALNFDKMQPFIQNNVIRDINKEAEESDFYDCFAPIPKVEE